MPCRKICLCIWYLVMVVTAGAQSAKFPLTISPNKRYLVDQQGKPFFYNGDTGWMLFLNLQKQEVIDYLVDRKAKKFNVIQTMITGFAGKANVFGQKPFLDANDFATRQDAYFDHVDWVLHQVDSMGFYIAIAPLWAGCCGEGYGGKGAVGPNSIMNTNGIQKSREFGEYLGARYAKYKNILWIMGGDIDPFEDRETMRALALGIKSKAPWQLMTYHASSSHSSTDVWPDESWLSVVMTYTYFRGFNKAWNKDQPDVYEANYKEYSKTPVKPFFLGESTYEGEHDSWGSAIQARKQAYWSVLSGGFGNAYGSPNWNFPHNWRTYLNLPGASSLQHYFNLFQSLPWYELVPDSTGSLILSGAGDYAKNDLAIAAKTMDGEWLVAYIPSARTLTVDTKSLKGRNLKASWYDPRNGTTRLIKKINNGNETFTSPDNNDWVLIIN